MFTEEQIKQYRNDYSLIASSEYFIKTKKAELLRFVFNRVQIYLWRLVLEDLKAGIPFRALILKSRQLGCSTWIVIFFYWIISFYPNRNAMVVAQEDEPAMELADKAKLVYRSIKPELRPAVKTNNRHMLHFGNPNEEGDLGLESKLVVKTADSPILAASYTLHMLLASEAALWEAEKGLDLKERLSTALQTIPDEPGTFVFVETTARGDGYFKEMWDDSDINYRKIFISWVADDTYRKEINPDAYFELVDDSFHKYGDETEVVKGIEQELYKWYPEIIGLPEPLKSQKIQHEIMCRLNWRRYMIVNKCQGDKTIFQREYPLTPEEAFSGKGKYVFSQNLLKTINNHLEIYIPHSERYRYDAIEKKFELSRYGPLVVFNPPRKGITYCAGLDPAQGIQGGDPSGLVILQCPDLTQCVSFEEIIDPDDLAEMYYQLYQLYNCAYTGVEVNDKGGYLVVNSLKKLGVRNQYVREVLDSSNYKKTIQKFGWFSSPSTKPTMVSDMRQVIKNQNTTIKDIRVVSQLKKYMLLPNGHMKAIDGIDHLADAYMIALQMSKYIHKGNYTVVGGIPKWSFAWWESLLDKSESNVIGNVRRGPDNVSYL